MSVWKIVCRAYWLKTTPPELRPEIYLLEQRPPAKVPGEIGVQVRHKGHWHAKKVWPHFTRLVGMELRGRKLVAIPLMKSAAELVAWIAARPMMIRAEGGISHIARAVGTAAVVIYGGFAKPMWNGYREHLNIVRREGNPCARTCYSPGPCTNDGEPRACMRSISPGLVLERAAAYEGFD